MEINVSEQRGHKIIGLTGRMDATNAQDLEAAGRPVIEAGRSVVIDCGGLEFVSSAGLRVILSLAKTAGLAISFCALSPMVGEVFRISGLLSILTVHADLDAALGG